MLEQIADKVIESVLDNIEGEMEHYMFMSGKYNETDNEYMSDKSKILKIVCRKLINK